MVSQVFPLPHDPYDTDVQGYSPLHLAAMTDRFDELVDLIKRGGSLRQTTNEGLSVLDVLKARGYENESSNVHSIEALIIQWQSNLSNQNSHLCEQLPQNPPIYKAQIAQGVLEGQFELKAARAIQAHEVIMEYTGEVRCGAPSAYAMAITDELTIDAEKYGSGAEFANHSFPNVACFPVVDKGLHRSIMVALTSIPKDAPLHHDYGLSYFKNRRITPIELCPDSVAFFCAQTKNLTDFNALIEAEQQEYLASAADYLYQFPDTLIKFAQEGKIPRQTPANFFERMYRANRAEALGIADAEEHYQDICTKLLEIAKSHDL